MLTAFGRTVMLNYGALRHKFEFAAIVGDTAVERRGNAIRVFWKHKGDDPCAPWRGAFELPVDDIGLDRAKVYPVTCCDEYGKGNIL